ncbi:DUF397 domain-containing protein [Actinomadura geliboluensis]|uniref:DUF397 domain-containing protein n=1 Tax=Actinomadura geliboluensis TaxID=882440 RepID=UPI00367F32E4
MKDGAHLTWRKSSYTGQEGGTCVELADLNPMVGVRDSTDPGGPVLQFGRDAMRRLVLSVKSGGFHHPAQDEA